MLLSAFQPTRLALAELKPTDENFSIDAVNLLLSAAVRVGASDLHLHPRAAGLGDSLARRRCADGCRRVAAWGLQ